MTIPFFRETSIALYEFVFKLHFYKLFPCKHSRDKIKAIVFVDNRRLPYKCFEGKVRYGVADRLRNILSVYSFCKEYGIDFRIKYTFPFDLTDYLLPNTYDWRISDNQISDELLTTKILLLSCQGNISDNIDGEKHLAKLKKQFSRNRFCTQFHIYGNSYFAKNDFHTLFYELFRPAEPVINAVRTHQAAISSTYESVSLRFRALLGDLEDGNSHPLPHDEQLKLMKNCGDKLEALKNNGYFKTGKILITSDSKKFLEYAGKRFDFVYFVPGIRVNAEFARIKNDEAFLRIFIDLLMLSDAERLTLLVTSDMYESGFPHLAALIGNKPYKVIKW